MSGRRWSVIVRPVTIVPTPDVGEDLEQQDVGHPAVEDVGRATPLRTAWTHDAILGIIPPVRRAVGQQRVQLVGGGLADQAGRVVDVAAQALDVGEVDELLGAERLGDGAGDGVGVDVVGLPGCVGADGGHDRDQVLGEQALRGSTG